MFNFMKKQDTMPDLKDHRLISNLDSGNLAGQLDKLKKKKRNEVYSDIMDRYGDANQSMQSWLKKYERAINLASMTPTKDGKEIESKDIPFEGASLAMTPFILEAMLDFSGRASPELVWTPDIVKARIVGAEEEIETERLPEEQQAQAEPIKDQISPKRQRQERVQDYMNYQLASDIPEWRENQDKAILSLPCVGTAYKKTYYDYEEKRICSDLRMADKVIFDMNYTSFKLAPDKFEILKYSQNEVIGFIRGEQAWDLKEKDIIDSKDREHEFIEAHTWIDLDEDGLKEPYCVILHEKTNDIVCMYPDYDEDTLYFNDAGEVIKVRDANCYTQYIFLPDPCGGPMGMGWGILLGPTFAAINQMVRDNIDAGTLNVFTSNSGLIAASVGTQQGNRTESGEVAVRLGQLTKVSMAGLQGSLQQNVVQFPFAGASQTLLELTQWMTESARNMTTAAYSTDANPGEAAELYLARLQQGLKNPNSIIMRVYECAREEFTKIALLNYKHYDNDQYLNVLDVTDADMQADFEPKDCDIELVADPSQGSDIERVAQAKNAHDMALSHQAAGISSPIDLREASIRLLKAQRTQDIETLVPPPQQGPSEMEQLIAAQQAAEMEFRKEELDLKRAKLELERAEAAHKSAKELIEMGLMADKDEAEISKTYADALAVLVEKAGLPYDRARAEILRNEQQFIDNNTERSVQHGERALPPGISGTG